MKVVLLSILLLALGVTAMAFKVLLVKGGKFPSIHAHSAINRKKVSK